MPGWMCLMVLHLHAQDGEDVDDDEEDEGEVAQGAQGGDDDAQQDLEHSNQIWPHSCHNNDYGGCVACDVFDHHHLYLHGGPGLRQLQNSHLPFDIRLDSAAEAQSPSSLSRPTSPSALSFLLLSLSSSVVEASLNVMLLKWFHCKR